MSVSLLSASVPRPRVPKEGTCPATRLWDVCWGVWDLMSGLSGAGQNRHREEDVSKLSEKGEKKSGYRRGQDRIAPRAGALDSSTRAPTVPAPSRPRWALI